MSSMVGNCTSSVEGSQSTINWYIAQFPSAVDYLMAWISNLGGNVVNMVNVVDGITEAAKICDLPTIYYDSGRVMRYMVRVMPVELVTRESMRKQRETFL